ncbi:MAG: RecJ-like exonuclease [Candidatus Lokiarchaeum sp. GC14_75]|nr:MAG: RecJ-like exonuclease [Candidatus Lokiarchaeum sp. GC14_75]
MSIYYYFDTLIYYIFNFEFIVISLNKKMESDKARLNKLYLALEEVKDRFLSYTSRNKSPVRIYTHLDADGLSSGAILGKALYREEIPFQITVLRQLERLEIAKIIEGVTQNKNFLIFSDFGSGQYLELQKNLISKYDFNALIILDHHIPQQVSNKEDTKKIEEIYEETKKWQVNPYFWGIDGSLEISGAGMCYCFAKCLNKANLDLAHLAITGAIGDIQNKGRGKSFQGVNKLILKDATNSGQIEVMDDLNYSAIKPLNEAIAYSSDLILPGLSNDINKSLIFLKTRGILMENPDGRVKTLNELNQDEKKIVSSAIIEYASLKLDLEPIKIIQKLIVNRYLLKKELKGSDLHDIADFSNLLNACGRTQNSSIGISIAMGDRKDLYQKSKQIITNYRKSLVKSLSWIKDNDLIKQKEWIQYFYGEEVIPESIIGTVTSMLIFGKNNIVDKSRPLFGLAKRNNEEVYKVSGRAHEKIVSKGVNLSRAIREACQRSNLDILGGGHPPAAGTKIPVDKIDLFLENCNIVVGNQINVPRID